ncbi:MAG: cytochrome oxidase putative small subunit CydP [Sulfurimicrobium sp.]
MRNKPLLRHLSIALVLKTALLWLLWALFIRGQHVAVNPAHMGSRLTLSPFFSNVPIGGNNDRPVRC